MWGGVGLPREVWVWEGWGVVWIGLNQSAGGDRRRLNRHREVICARERKVSCGGTKE